MSRAERVWQEFTMVWLERFALAILALMFWNWVLNNGLHMDGHFRIALGLLVLGASYGIGHAVYLEAQKAKIPAQSPVVVTPPQASPILPSPAPSAPEAPQKRPSIKQHSTGPNSPNVVTGDNSKVEIKQE